MKKFAIMLVLMGAPVGAQIVSFNGNRLLGFCQSRGEAEAGICYGYVLGVLDGVSMAEILAEDEVYTVCNQDGVTGDQQVAIVKKYLETEPETGHQPAAILVKRAMLQAFPCE